MELAGNAIIIVDTREPQLGSWEEHLTIPTVRKKLDTGDYSILGAEHLISIERKSLPDLLQSLTHERSRFERELARARALDFSAVIVEASAADVLAGRFGPHAKGCNPRSIWESVCCFSVRYCPFLFAHNPATAAAMCQSSLLKWVREHEKIIENVVKGSRSLVGHAEKRNTPCQI